MKPREILITNDDGIEARGLHFLAGIMRHYGNVTIVAPKEPQSAKSAALTLHTPIYLEKVGGEEGFRIFTLTGTTADCVKMGMRLFLEEGRTPDLLMSGINHGTNASVATVYSGTLGATAEGSIYDVPSIGFSIDTHDPDPDFSIVAQYGPKILDEALENGLPSGTYLNVNFPNIPPAEVKGIRVTRMGRGRWVREYDPETDEQGRECYVMRGVFENLESSAVVPAFGEGITGDHVAIKAGYIAITPVRLDNTDYIAADEISNSWKL
ncbi:MAG: 5'/3'-nucleotidase SurE [Bacteroidales bacterium]|nr:5'/3'-nucleotidase SurE [Bacteroidales bacterium]